MSYDTIGDRSAYSDWESNGTPSTGVSSKASKGTTTSGGSKRSRSSSRYSAVIWLKIVVVVITMVGGAILAFLINVVGKSTCPEKANTTHQYDQLLQSVPDEKKYGSIILYRFKNKVTNLCLSDSTGNSLLVNNCEEYYKDEQFFSIENDALIVHRDSKTMCASVDKENVKMLPCTTRDEDQAWTYLKNEKIYHYKTKKCLIGTDLKAGDVVKLVDCKDDDKSQMWTCDKVFKKEPKGQKDEETASMAIISKYPSKESNSN